MPTIPAHTGQFRALNDAWNSDDAALSYAELNETGRVLRDAARLELAADDLAAVRSVDLDDLDELRSLLSWIDDSDMWHLTSTD